MAVKIKKKMTLKRSIEIVLGLAVAGKAFADDPVVEEEEMDEAIKFLREKWAKLPEN
jgi:hypothetical protein